MDSAAEEKGRVLWSAEQAETDACAELVADLRMMVNQAACSDVVFVCKDGERVHASRLLVVGRSEMFKSMLMNGMAESGLSEINLPEISSPVLLSVFEFLYTGTMLNNPPLSWRMGFEIIEAARFFLLPKLEKIGRKFLLTQVSDETDLPKAILMLNEAMEFKTVCDEKDAILLELLRTLGSNWLQPVYARNLSAEGIHYLLTATRSNCEDDDHGELSFQEYLRFRQVMLWWTCQNCSVRGQPEELINSVLPVENEALCLWRDPYNVGMVESRPGQTTGLSSDLNSVLVDEASRDSALRLLSKIDWRCIPPLLLVKVVEPLRIISSSELLKAFQFHALRRTIHRKMPECAWNHGECYRVLDGGSVIQKAREAVGFAAASVAMPRPDGVYQWHFIIEEFSNPFLDLGFIYSLSGLHGQKLKLDESLAARHAARALTCDSDRKVYVDGQKENDAGDGRRSLPCKLALKSKVEFCFRASDHTCSLNIDGHDHGVAWRDLPNAIYYPAVCFGSSSSGRIRIHLGKGFDVL